MTCAPKIEKNGGKTVVWAWVVEFEVAFAILQFCIRALRTFMTVQADCGLKTSDRGWTVMNVLKALMQNCKMANATSNSTSVVLTENDIPGAA